MSETPIDDIRSQVEEQYIAEKKEEVYRTQNDSWLGAADIKRNGSVWDSVKVTAPSAAEPAAAEETQAEGTVTEAAAAAE